MLQGILWAGVCRNNMVLAEAGEDNRDGAVVEVAQKLLHKKPTHGWECKLRVTSCKYIGRDTLTWYTIH
jgi:hypothetical protein